MYDPEFASMLAEQRVLLLDIRAEFSAMRSDLSKQIKQIKELCIDTVAEDIVDSSLIGDERDSVSVSSLQNSTETNFSGMNLEKDRKEPERSSIIFSNLPTYEVFNLILPKSILITPVNMKYVLAVQYVHSSLGLNLMLYSKWWHECHKIQLFSMVNANAGFRGSVGWPPPATYVGFGIIFYVGHFMGFQTGNQVWEILGQGHNKLLLFPLRQLKLQTRVTDHACFDSGITGRQWSSSVDGLVVVTKQGVLVMVDEHSFLMSYVFHQSQYGCVGLLISSRVSSGQIAWCGGTASLHFMIRQASSIDFCGCFDPGISVHDLVLTPTVTLASFCVKYLLGKFWMLTQRGLSFSPPNMSNYKALEYSGRRKVLITFSAMVFITQSYAYLIAYGDKKCGPRLCLFSLYTLCCSPTIRHHSFSWEPVFFRAVIIESANSCQDIDEAEDCMGMLKGIFGGYTCEYYDKCVQSDKLDQWLIVWVLDGSNVRWKVSFSAFFLHKDDAVWLQLGLNESQKLMLMMGTANEIVQGPERIIVFMEVLLEEELDVGFVGGRSTGLSVKVVRKVEGIYVIMQVFTRLYRLPRASYYKVSNGCVVSPYIIRLDLLELFLILSDALFIRMCWDVGSANRYNLVDWSSSGSYRQCYKLIISQAMHQPYWSDASIQRLHKCTLNYCIQMAVWIGSEAQHHVYDQDFLVRTSGESFTLLAYDCNLSTQHFVSSIQGRYDIIFWGIWLFDPGIESITLWVDRIISSYNGFTMIFLQLVVCLEPLIAVQQEYCYNMNVCSVSFKGQTLWHYSGLDHYMVGVICAGHREFIDTIVDYLLDSLTFQSIKSSHSSANRDLLKIMMAIIVFIMPSKAWFMCKVASALEIIVLLRLAEPLAYSGYIHDGFLGRTGFIDSLTLDLVMVVPRVCICWPVFGILGGCLMQTFLYMGILGFKAKHIAEFLDMLVYNPGGTDVLETQLVLKNWPILLMIGGSTFVLGTYGRKQTGSVVLSTSYGIPQYNLPIVRHQRSISYQSAYIQFMMSTLTFQAWQSEYLCQNMLEHSFKDILARYGIPTDNASGPILPFVSEIVVSVTALSGQYYINGCGLGVLIQTFCSDMSRQIGGRNGITKYYYILIAAHGSQDFFQKMIQNTSQANHVVPRTDSINQGVEASIPNEIQPSKYMFLGYGGQVQLSAQSLLLVNRWLSLGRYISWHRQKFASTSISIVSVQVLISSRRPWVILLLSSSAKIGQYNKGDFKEVGIICATVIYDSMLVNGYIENNQALWARFTVGGDTLVDVIW